MKRTTELPGTLKLCLPAEGTRQFNKLESRPSGIGPLSFTNKLLPTSYEYLSVGTALRKGPKEWEWERDGSLKLWLDGDLCVHGENPVTNHPMEPEASQPLSCHQAPPPGWGSHPSTEAHKPPGPKSLPLSSQGQRYSHCAGTWLKISRNQLAASRHRRRKGTWCTVSIDVVLPQSACDSYPVGHQMRIIFPSIRVAHSISHHHRQLQFAVVQECASARGPE